MRRLAFITRWLARIGSLLSIALLVLFMFGGEEAPPLPAMTGGETVLFIFFPIGVIAGMVLGWFREPAGAAVTIASLLGFYSVHLVRSGDLPGGVWFVVFALPGVLFGVAWALRQ